MSVGTPIIIILAEEREKHNLESLRLAGVTAGQYILSALIWPAIIGIFFISSLPRFWQELSFLIRYSVMVWFSC